MTVTKFGLALAGLAFSASFAFAQAPAFKPAIVYDLGGKFDKSFNEGVHTGAEKYKKDKGTDYRDFEPQNDAQREQALRRFARDGFSPILAVGFSQESALKKVADEFPNTKFAIIDAVVEKPNVQSILFKEHEGSFLVGLLAAQASKTGKVGFVGGMDIPLIRKFACGYVQGVKYAKKGGELAKSQIDRGADVVYHAAGGTGIGVMRATADAGKLGIGVDSNQNGLHPGKELTSMVKRVDVATYNVFDQAKKNTFKAGVSNLGLAEDGVAWALDDHNKALITADMKAAADKAAADIKSGAIKVHDYMSDSKCPM